MIQCRLVKIF